MENKGLELRDFLYNVKELKAEDEKIMDKLEDLFSDCLESPVVDLAWSYFDLAIKFASKYFMDEEHNISFFIFDNNFGANEIVMEDGTVIDSIETFVIWYMEN